MNSYGHMFGTTDSSSHGFGNYQMEEDGSDQGCQMQRNDAFNQFHRSVSATQLFDDRSPIQSFSSPGRSTFSTFNRSNENLFQRTNTCPFMNTNPYIYSMLNEESSNETAPKRCCKVTFIQVGTAFQLFCERTHNKSITFVDCRYPYEYDGGHVTGSVNCWDDVTIKKSLFSTYGLNKSVDSSSTCSSSNILVLYCEFSSRRVKEITSRIQSMDRSMNGNLLKYYDLRIVEGGFKKIHSEKNEMCCGCYIPMDDPDYSSICDYYVKHSSDVSRSRSCSCENMID